MELLRTILELVYFISAPIIAVIAAVGLCQISITKGIARTTAKRDSLSLAAQQCEHYLRCIIPLQDTLNEAIKEKDVTYIVKAEVTVDGDRIRVKFDQPEGLVDQAKSINSELNVVLNAMEAFAVFFMTGSADERIGFSSVGLTFCYTTRALLPAIVPYLDPGYYRNLHRLFLLWNSRIESQKLLDEKKTLEQKLQKLDNKFIEPVGTV